MFHIPHPLSSRVLSLCRGARPGDLMTRTSRWVNCENCLYIADVQTRAMDLTAAIGYGTAAVFGIRKGELEEDIRELAAVSAHFSFRLLEGVAA